MRPVLIRRLGPEMLSAANTSPRAPRTGAAIADRPTSSSSIDVAKPSRRTAWSSRVVAASAVPVVDAGARPNAVNTLPLAECCVAHRAPEPLPRAEEVPAVHLGDVLDPVMRGHGQVDRLTACLRQRVKRRSRQLHQVSLEHAALGHPKDRRPRPQAPALAVLLDQSAALERADQARGGALGQPGRAREVGQRHRLLAFEHTHEQVGAAVDRGRPLRSAHATAASIRLELLFHAR